MNSLTSSESMYGPAPSGNISSAATVGFIDISSLDNHGETSTFNKYLNQIQTTKKNQTDVNNQNVENERGRRTKRTRRHLSGKFSN